MSNKRILVFSLAYYPVEGGAEIAVREIIKRIRDVHFDIVTMRFDDSHEETECGENYTIHRIKAFKATFPFRAFSFASELRKKHHYEFSWAIMANWAGLAALLYKFWFPGERYVLTLQEGDPIPYIMKKAMIIGPFFKYIFRWADGIQAISNYLAKWAKDMGYAGKVSVVPNGVDFQAFQGFRKRPFNRDDIVLITTSRLVEKNAVGDIIEALKLLPENVSLKIIGRGPLEYSLKRQAGEAWLGHRIEFMGNVPYEDIPLHLSRADIFVRPSLSEGFGNSFIEAMAAGIPVIATPVGGIPDFLEDEKTGIFCEPANPESIAEKVRIISANRELREELVKNAKRMVEERYRWDLVAERMKKEVFDPLLADR